MTSFLYGLIIAFSPCVLVMLPIILKMCGSIKGTFYYLFGGMISYAVLGVLLATVGIYFQTIMHTWPVLLLFSVVLGYLALSCFDLVRLPQYYIQSTNSFLIGLLTPIIVSPCMTPALGAIITLMVQEGCIKCGVLDLLMFGLGVNAPLVLGSFGLGKFLKNPRVRKYSVWITKLNGLLIISLIVYLWL